MPLVLLINFGKIFFPQIPFQTLVAESLWAGVTQIDLTALAAPPAELVAALLVSGPAAPPIGASARLAHDNAQLGVPLHCPGNLETKIKFN